MIDWDNDGVVEGRSGGNVGVGDLWRGWESGGVNGRFSR
jgi:hypothetical protein